MVKFFVVLLVLLSGCAAPMQKPAHIASKDWNQCRYEALKVEASHPNVIIGMSYGRETMQMCLNNRGY